MAALLHYENMEIFALALFFISFFGLITSRNMIKSIIYIMLFQTSVVMFWLMLGRVGEALPMPPIINDPELLYDMSAIADPLPQALTLTAIIIGFAVIAIIITMMNVLTRKHGTADWNKLMVLEGQVE
ncbi:MAG: cation:proton antiporter subunit C [Defluviitaleaceae bacterium]|nr:cation:proton antiporter subunit C [Defluviitaleaceae bacterium]